MRPEFVQALTVAGLLSLGPAILTAQQAQWAEVVTDSVVLSVPNGWVRLPFNETTYVPKEHIYVRNGRIEFSRGVTVSHAARAQGVPLEEASRRFGNWWAGYQGARQLTPWSRMQGSGWCWARFTLPSAEGGDELVDILSTDHQGSLFWMAFTRPAKMEAAMRPLWESIKAKLRPAPMPPPVRASAPANSQAVDNELARQEAISRAMNDHRFIFGR